MMDWHPWLFIFTSNAEVKDKQKYYYCYSLLHIAINKWCKVLENIKIKPGFLNLKFESISCICLIFQVLIEYLVWIRVWPCGRVYNFMTQQKQNVCTTAASPLKTISKQINHSPTYHSLNFHDRGVGLIPKIYLNFSWWILIELDETNTPI